MTISPTSTTTLLQLLQNSQESHTSSVASLPSAAGIGLSPGFSPPTTLANDSANVSNLAKLFSELEQLSKQNPAGFKSVTEQIGQQLQAAATNTAHAPEASALNQLARNFEAASKSRSVADLFPTGSQASGSGSQLSGQAYSASTPPGNSTADGTLNSIFALALSRIQSYPAGS